MQNVKEYRSPIHFASFDTFEAKNGQLFGPQSASKVSSEIDFWPIYLQNSSK